MPIQPQDTNTPRRVAANSQPSGPTPSPRRAGQGAAETPFQVDGLEAQAPASPQRSPSPAPEAPAAPVQAAAHENATALGGLGARNAWLHSSLPQTPAHSELTAQLMSIIDNTRIAMNAAALRLDRDVPTHLSPLRHNPISEHMWRQHFGDAERPSERPATSEAPAGWHESIPAYLGLSGATGTRRTHDAGASISTPPVGQTRAQTAASEYIQRILQLSPAPLTPTGPRTPTAQDPLAIPAWPGATNTPEASNGSVRRSPFLLRAEAQQLGLIEFGQGFGSRSWFSREHARTLLASESEDATALVRIRSTKELQKFMSLRDKIFVSQEEEQQQVLVIAQDIADSLRTYTSELPSKDALKFGLWQLKSFIGIEWDEDIFNPPELA